MNLAIIIPARGGSQRVPRKNLAQLAGRPLIDHTFDLLRKTKLTPYAWVSTEDEEITAHTKASGLNVIPRPPELATHDTPTEAVLLHALDFLPAPPDWLMTLPPTNPLRTTETMRQIITTAEAAPKSTDCIMTVTPTLGDYWQKKDAQLKRLFPKAPRTQQARQAGGWTLYEENSAIYLTRSNILRQLTTQNHPTPVLGTSVQAVEISPSEALDINTPEDLALAEALLETY